jgi:homocysteine S-methyltransferase
MDNPFAPWLSAGRTVILDGGLGTELERRGHHDLGRLWSSALVEANPSALRGVHRDFLEAGADVIATATYQAAMPTLLECGHSRQNSTLILQEAVRLAIEERDAHAPAALVAASIGPFGAHLADGSEYSGDYTMTAGDLHTFQADRWHILADSAADIIACETMPSLADVRAVVRLLHETPKRWAWISLMCRDATHLADGTPLSEVFARLNDVPNLAAVGANCIPPSLAPEIIDTFRAATTLPLMIYPNASNAWNLNELSADEFAMQSASWTTHGARIIGGCCKTTPEHVRALRAEVQRSEPQRSESQRSDRLRVDDN